MAKKYIKINGEGSIEEVERGRKYRIRLRIPPKQPGDKRRWSPRRTVYGNKAQARIEIEKYRKELEAELNDDRPHLTLGTYAREFQDKRKQIDTLSPATIKRDEAQIKRIEDFFNNVEITELTPIDITNAFAYFRNEGCSVSELHKFSQKLNQILKNAVKEGLIDKNPCDNVDTIKTPVPKPRKSLSFEQACKLAADLKNSKRDGKIVAVWLALATGIRRGEALGLQWKYVDLSHSIIKIEKQLDDSGVLRKPKSRSSIRTVAIDNGTVLFLKEWQEMQSASFFSGEKIPGDFPVCTNEHGDFLSGTNFSRWRRNYFAEHGLGHFKEIKIYYDKNGTKRSRGVGFEGFDFHELRHTQATLLIGSGADIKTVQARLGHSSASLTMNIYAHAIEQNDREAAETIGCLLDNQSTISSD